MTTVSRVLGLVRDVVIARLFGAGLLADAFFVAFKIPNLFRRLFAEGAFSQAFVPVLSEYKLKHGNDAVKELIGATAGSMALVLFLVVSFGVLAAPYFIVVFAPGFIDQPDKWGIASTLLRITFPYLLFISMTALLGSVLNTYGRFAVPAITPALLNISLITAAYLIAPALEQPILALAIGVFFGGVLQFLLQAAAVSRLGLLPVLRIRFDHPGVRQILALMGPAVFGVSVAQINLMIDTLIASFLQTGSISWLYYSDRLVEFPLGVFGIALATVILPNLSEQHLAGRSQLFSDMLDWALRWVVLIAIPASVALALLAGPMLSTLFQYGALTERDVFMAARSLVAYSGGLTAFILIKILAPGFYARQDTRTPVKMGIIAMCSNIVLNLLFVVPLAHAGLALATSLAAFINAGLLLRVLLAEGTYRPLAGWPTFALKVALATAVMGAILVAASGSPQVWSDSGVSGRVLRLAGLVAMGAATYFAGVFALGIRPGDMAQPGREV